MWGQATRTPVLQHFIALGTRTDQIKASWGVPELHYTIPALLQSTNLSWERGAKLPRLQDHGTAVQQLFSFFI